MVLQEQTNIVKTGNSLYFLIPFKLLTDSKFPFSQEDPLQMEIKKNKIIVTKDEEEIENE